MISHPMDSERGRDGIHGPKPNPWERDRTVEVQDERGTAGVESIHERVALVGVGSDRLCLSTPMEEAIRVDCVNVFFISLWFPLYSSRGGLDGFLFTFLLSFESYTGCELRADSIQLSNREGLGKAPRRRRCQATRSEIQESAIPLF